MTAMTDEQIGRMTHRIRDSWLNQVAALSGILPHGGVAKTFNIWLTAVEARARKQERQRIVEQAQIRVDEIMLPVHQRALDAKAAGDDVAAEILSHQVSGLSQAMSCVRIAAHVTEEGTND